MATENRVLDITLPALEDLSNDQFRALVIATGGVRRPDSGTEIALGVLQNAPNAAGQPAVVRVVGITKWQANAALGQGALVMAEYVSATDAGKASVSTGAPAYTRGIVIEASDAEDDLCSVLLSGVTPGITDAVSHNTVVTTDATAGANTYTAAELVGGMILRDPAGDNRSDVSPTGTALVAAIAGCIDGSSFEFTIRNTADAAETITLTAGADVTLSGTMTIAQNNSKRFLCVITSVAAHTATIYSLGTVVH
jgi:hypothetical protein